MRRRLLTLWAFPWFLGSKGPRRPGIPGTVPVSDASRPFLTMRTVVRSEHPQISQAFRLLSLLLLGCLTLGLGACAGPEPADGTLTPEAGQATSVLRLTGTPDAEATTAAAPTFDLVLVEEEIDVVPLPVRAGIPFSVTVPIHNESRLRAVDVPLMLYVSAVQERIGYTPYLEILTVTVPASETVPVELWVDWNFAGGEHQIWLQANRLPEAWQTRIPLQPEADITNNAVLLNLMIDPFDAYLSDLCPGRVDVQVGPADVLPEPDRQRVLVRVHNVGNRAVYNLPVVVTGQGLTGIRYTPSIPPCGGTAEVYVEVDRPIKEGETLSVQVNPAEWPDNLAEDEFDNNAVTVAAGLRPGVEIPVGGSLDDYDFSITPADIEIPELWIAQITVHNLGTRDAAMVPIRIENEAGRKFTDAIPLVRGEGLGVAAIRIGYLWTRGGKLTFTVNPQDADDAYPERNRENNVATFTLP